MYRLQVLFLRNLELIEMNTCEDIFWSCVMKRIKARVTKSDVVLIDIGFAGGKTFWIKMSWMFCSDGNDIRRADSIENAFQIQFSCL